MPPKDLPTGAEVPAEAVTEPLPNLIDPDEFTPRLLALLSNRLVHRESTLLRRQFGLGTNEWRVLSAVAGQPGSTMTAVADYLAANMAIVSKSVSALLERELIVAAEVRGRSKPLYLTPAGVATHDEMLPISMQGQDIVLEGMSDAEVRRLNALLRTLLRRAQAIDLA